MVGAPSGSRSRAAKLSADSGALGSRLGESWVETIRFGIKKSTRFSRWYARSDI